MTDLLLAIIILILLFQTHSKEKNVGKYGRLCVFLEKRVLGYLIKQGKGTYHKVKCKITVSNIGRLICHTKAVKVVINRLVNTLKRNNYLGKLKEYYRRVTW